MKVVRELFYYVFSVTLIAAHGLCLPRDAAADRVIAADENKISIAVSISPQAYFLKKISGEWINCLVLIPSGANHDVVETTISQARALAKAKTLFSIGHPNYVGERTWIERLKEIAPNLVIVPVLSVSDFNADDIHVWTSPILMEKMVQIMGDEMGRMLPEHRDELAERTKFAVQEIRSVSSDIHAQLDSYRGEHFLVLHPSWGYFAMEYGLRQLAIETDEKEPGPGQLRELVREARNAGIGWVYADRGYSASSIAPISEALSLKSETVDVLAENWPAEMRRMGSLLLEEFSGRTLNRRNSQKVGSSGGK